MMGGAFTAIVNLDDGSVTKLPFTASLAYFDPTCNPATHTAVFTALRDTKTRLVTVNVKGATVADTTAEGEITSAVPTKDGVIAVAGNRLVHVDRKGKTTKLAATKHAPYGIHVTGDDKVSYIDRTGNTDANVQTYADGKKTTVASGKLTAMNLRQGTDGTVYLTGKASYGKGFTASGIKPLDVPPDAEVSTRGRLAVDPVVSPAVHAGIDHIKNAGRDFTKTATKKPAAEATPGPLSHALIITGTVPGTGKHTEQKAAEPGSTAGGTPSPALTGSSKPQLSKMSMMTAATDDPSAYDPVDTDAWCSVPRNDVTTQASALQAKTQVKLPGPVFALAASKQGAIDVGTVEKDKSVVSRWHSGELNRLGSAKVGTVKLFPAKGGDMVVGDVADIKTIDAPGLAKQQLKDRPMGVSREGHLVTTSIASRQMKGITTKLGSPSNEGAGIIDIRGIATKTRITSSVAIPTDAELPMGSFSAPSADSAVFNTAASGPDDKEPLNCGEGMTESACLAAFGTYIEGAIPGFEIPCLVKRNDPKRQALQPSANLVEWAVDQAVHGQLTDQRPSNWHDTGLPAFSPQGLFLKPALSGGGTIPAQVMLGILAQESNFKQASWHSMYGTSGNPLQSDWFGNGASIHYYPDRGKSDCGYGIGQVTTGMSEMDSLPFTATEAGAVATDYAANIAAGLQILAGKWNQLKGLGMQVNNGDPQYVENWYTALWGYNSGVYTDPLNRTGLGWFNNPANPDYPPDRQGFLRASYDDASHPADWPYQEKVLGWVETPQKTWNNEPSYAQPEYTSPVGGQLNLPDFYTFCDPAINSCTPGAADPCPAWNSSCYFNGSVTWISNQDRMNSAVERLSYALGSGEPTLERMYPTGPCIEPPNGDASAIIVDDLAEHENTYGCGDFEASDDGKFSLQLGDNFTYYRDDGTMRATPYIAQIDLHQLSAGYDGHSFFTHSYPAGDIFHKVTGRWEVNQKYLPNFDQLGKHYDVFVHVPNHGAEAIVRYNFIPGKNDEGLSTHSCRLPQKTVSNGADVWVEMGSFTFWKGGRIEADNLHDAGTGDDNVNFDAIAFVPIAFHVPGYCWKDSGGY